MTLRNCVLALAARWKLGAQAPTVLKMLSEARQNAVQTDLEAIRDLPPEAAMERLAGLRARQSQRLDRLARCRFGDGWNRLDPRVRHSILHHGKRQDH
jgi:hypothetical protein